jgi:tetratricopeptide (TPR) repeat protein
MLHEHPQEAQECLEAVATPAAIGAAEPLAVDALAYLSSVRWSLGDIEGARDASDRALELGPERFAPNQKAGEMALRLGDLERAADLFLAAVRASEPGTADSKAAEISLREARRRVSHSIRHEAKAPRMSGWLARMVAGRRHDREATRPAEPELTALQ